MADTTCIDFLEWALPRLGLAWPGYRRVHRQVCKRLSRRIAELRLPDYAAYRRYVLAHDTELQVVDASCHITISRFYRDKDVFDRLRREVLPRLAEEAGRSGAAAVSVWCAGCGAGEEPYGLVLAWELAVATRFPGIAIRVLATDIDQAQLERAGRGCYRPGSLRELPADWREIAFEVIDGLYCLRREYRQAVEFRRQDIRSTAPSGIFDLILCRNLAFTYFDPAGQRRALAALLERLRPGGVLVLGRRESPPDDAGLQRADPGLPIFRKPVLSPPPP